MWLTTTWLWCLTLPGYPDLDLVLGCRNYNVTVVSHSPGLSGSRSRSRLPEPQRYCGVSLSQAISHYVRDCLRGNGGGFQSSQLALHWVHFPSLGPGGLHWLWPQPPEFWIWRQKLWGTEVEDSLQVTFPVALLYISLSQPVTCGVGFGGELALMWW